MQESYAYYSVFFKVNNLSRLITARAVWNRQYGTKHCYRQLASGEMRSDVRTSLIQFLALLIFISVFNKTLC